MRQFGQLYALDSLFWRSWTACLYIGIYVFWSFEFSIFNNSAYATETQVDRVQSTACWHEFLAMICAAFQKNHGHQHSIPSHTDPLSASIHTVSSFIKLFSNAKILTRLQAGRSQAPSCLQCARFFHSSWAISLMLRCHTQPWSRGWATCPLVIMRTSSRRQ